MTHWDEKIAVAKWLELKRSAEHYERMLANAEASTHSEAEFWASQWRVHAADKRRQMDAVLAALPTREELLKEVA